MRINKFITALLTAFIISAVFLIPVTAYANEGINTDVENTETAETAVDNPEIVVDNPDESNEDYIDEQTEILDISDSDINEPPNESAVPDNSKAFTPDGQASVVDLAYEGDGKMFYTFKTPAGNVFYLIIDRQRGTDNVYFLNAVTESDLLALAENAGTNKVNESAIPTTDPTTSKPNGDSGTGDNPDDPNAEDDNPPTKKSNNGMLIFLLIGVAAVGIAAYYIKVIRPKQQAEIDEDEDIPDEDDGEEMQFEDEPEEADGDEYEDSDDSDNTETE